MAQTHVKPQVVYFSDEPEIVERVARTLGDRFEVTPVMGVTGLDEALDTLREILPDFVIIDPNLPTLDHQQLHRRVKVEQGLKDIQILLVRDDELGL